MSVLQIDYDLVIPGQNYNRLITYLKSYDAWAHALKSTWLVRTSKSVEQVLDEITALVDTNDKVLISDITGVEMGWKGLSPDVSEWIKNNNPASAYR